MIDRRTPAEKLEDDRTEEIFALQLRDAGVSLQAARDFVARVASDARVGEWYRRDDARREALRGKTPTSTSEPKP
jgi:hypothetical protein